MEQLRGAVEGRIDAGVDVLVLQLVQRRQAFARIGVRSDLCVVAVVPGEG